MGRGTPREPFQTWKSGPAKNEYHGHHIKTNGFLPPRVRPRCRSYTPVGQNVFSTYPYPSPRSEVSLRYVHKRKCPRRQKRIIMGSYAEKCKNIRLRPKRFILSKATRVAFQACSFRYKFSHLARASPKPEAPHFASLLHRRRLLAVNASYLFSRLPVLNFLTSANPPP